MKPWQKAILAISLVVSACLVADTVSAKGGRRGGGAGKVMGSLAKGFGKLVDDLTDDGPTYSPPPSSYLDATPPIAKDYGGGQYGGVEEKPYIPEKLQEKIDKQPGKPQYNFSGVMACVCGNNVLFTNVVCMPCADGEQMIEKSLTKL